jgi:PAS domain S-box-containing protein
LEPTTLFGGRDSQANRRLASGVAGFAAAAIAATALVGWWASLPLLSSWGSVAMKPTEAVLLAALGFALVHPGNESRFAFVIGLAVAVMGVVVFSINRELLQLPPALAPASGVGQPATGSGMALAIVPVAGALALSRFERHHVVTGMLGGLGGVMAIFAIVAYLAGIESTHGTVRTPGLPTAVSLLCVVIGIGLRIGTIPAPHTSQPLWRLLIVVACAIIAPLLLLTVYAGFRITDAQVDQAHKDLMKEALTLSAEVDHEINGYIERMQALATSPSLRRADFAEFQRQAEAPLALGQSGNIMLIDREMRQLVNTWVPFGTPMPEAVVQEPVERALATGKPQVTGLFMGPVSRQPLFSIIVPVQIDGENRYALVRSPDRSVMTGLLKAHQLPPGWQAVVADATHRIIAQSGGEEDGLIGTELPVSQQHRAGPSGVAECIDVQGQPSLEAYAVSNLTGWETIVWEPKALLEAPVHALWWTIVSVALLGFTLAVGVALWLSRIIARSVGQTARAAIALGKGKPLPSDETPVAEVNTLMAELRGAAARRQAAEQELYASKDRLQLAMDAAQLGLFNLDPRRGVFSANARLKEMYDFDAARDEFGFEELVERIHPDDLERFWAIRGAAFNPADPTPYVNEYRIKQRDGSVRWVEVLGRVYFESAGAERRAVNFVGTTADITERKEREEREHLLMREINHRAKNMLSVVDSIARQTAARNPEDFVERFSARIQALSVNQDLLVRNQWQGIDVEDLVRAQLTDFADLIGSRISLRGPRLLLNPTSAQAIGLALHELATNAGKYGALSTEKGGVDISWGIGDDAFTMRWTEHDGPPVSPPERRGFGTIVMATMAERGVRGDVKLDYAASGVTWRLTCPAENAIELGYRESGARGAGQPNA